MSFVAITSPGDAAGITTSTFAMTLTWPDRVLMAECSPAGGRVMRGYFQCQAPPAGGLWELALAALRSPGATAPVLHHVVQLDRYGQRLLLAGLDDPFLSAELSSSTWEQLARTLRDLPVTVLADTGPIGPEQPYALLNAADLVLLVMRPTLAQAAAAKPRLARLRQALSPETPLGLCLIGDCPYTARDLAGRLGKFVLTINLPDDPKTAAVLSDGGGTERTLRRIEFSPLIRAARTSAATISNFVARPSREMTTSLELKLGPSR